MKDGTIFFSYAREDSEFALKLAQDLRLGGANIWLDQIDIGAGDRWDLSIGNALKEAERMLVVLTPDSVSSHNVMDEVSYALEEGMKVIPILLKPCDIPFRLRRLQHIDFTKNYDTGINKVLPILVPEKYTAPEVDLAKNTLEQEPPFHDGKQSKAKGKKKIKAQADSKKQQEERSVKDQAAAVKNFDPSGKGSDKITKEASRKKTKFKLPLLVGGIIALLAIIVWNITGSGHNDRTSTESTDPSKNYNENSPIVIGKKYQGGIIFYIDSTRQHGLIAAEKDLGEYSWEDAMSKCNNLRSNGFSDWRLPTSDELDKLHQIKDQVGGFGNGNYWSSSEVENNDSNAWYQYFFHGSRHNDHKSSLAGVRAVRAY